jgi:hypothetical protein
MRLILTGFCNFDNGKFHPKSMFEQLQIVFLKNRFFINLAFII